MEHHFDVARLTREGILDMARKMGRSHTFLFYHWEHKQSRLILPRLTKCYLQRFWVDCFGKLVASGKTAMWSRTIQLEEEYAFTREYLAQRNRRLKYTRQGLVALHSNC